MLEYGTQGGQIERLEVGFSRPGGPVGCFRQLVTVSMLWCSCKKADGFVNNMVVVLFTPRLYSLRSELGGLTAVS
jgi:hypothetical protein